MKKYLRLTFASKCSNTVLMKWTRNYFFFFILASKADATPLKATWSVISALPMACTINPSVKSSCAYALPLN